MKDPNTPTKGRFPTLAWEAYACREATPRPLARFGHAAAFVPCPRA